jgi:hypothetical protein
METPNHQSELHWYKPEELSLLEVLLLFTLPVACYFYSTLGIQASWSRLPLNNSSYITLARMIQNGPPSNANEFWGLPILMAVISSGFHISLETSVGVISAISALGACIFAYRLYGGWVAAAFSVISRYWIILAVAGEAEPLFTMLLLGSFLAARSGRWLTASLLASLATTVRPVGAIGLAALGVVLIVQRRHWTKLAAMAGVSLAIAAAYLCLVWRIAGDPLVSFQRYSRGDWNSEWLPLAFPLKTIATSAVLTFHTMRWTGWLENIIWTCIIITVGIIACLPRSARYLFRKAPSETLAFYGFFAFFLCYRYRYITQELARYFIPMLPFMLFSVRRWIPKDRRVLYGMCVVSGLLACCQVVGFRRLFGFTLP